MSWLSLTCVILGLVWGSSAINRGVLYPFGPDHADQRLPVGDDVSSEEIGLDVPITFYDERYHSIYVNSNGHLSFNTDLPAYRADLILPIDYVLIAPFLADIDIQLSGNVFYRETQDPSLLDMVAREIHPNFPNSRSFRPRALFIVTWDNVGYYPKQYDPVNTFQVVVASDGAESFVFFLYPEISWIRGAGKGTPIIQDVPAQVGFDAGDGRRSYILEESGNENVRELSRRSNMGVPGVYLFRVGQLYGEDIQLPEIDEEEEAAGRRTCADGGDRTCSVNGMCRDYSEGFCCECQSSFVGNGVNCVQDDMQMRVNGKVSGTLNGQTLAEADLHAFLMFRDGRVYVAISRVEPRLGNSMKALYAFASGLNWLIAIPTDTESRNGYMITGGDFNRSVTVTYTDQGLSVTMQQTFTGLNADGHMEVNSVINGDIPVINEGETVDIPDYQEVFTRTAPGEIRSQTSQTFNVEGRPVPFRVEQTLTYKECAHKAHDDDAAQTVSVSRSYIHYENHEQQIVRYAQSNRLGETEQPPDLRDQCTKDGYPCGSNSQCVAYGDSYQCQCSEGFRLGRSQTCVDMDECAEHRNRCDPNADCYNNEGSYQCRCRLGFNGNGFTCETAGGCEHLQCDPNASCVYDTYQDRYTCACDQGFSGDGYLCERSRDCSDYNYCDRNARCEPGTDGYYQCVCNEGYEGDGERCTEASCNVINNCDINAECLYDPHSMTYQCRCAQGYSGDGYSCRLSADCRRDPRICDASARCENRGYDYLCVCNQGYRGDGYRCAPLGDSESYLMVAQGMTILQMPFTPSDDNQGKPVLSIPGQTAIGLDVDCFARYFYWTDVAGHVISKAQLDGTDSQVLVQDLGSPEGVAVDWITGNMYWTDSGMNRIEVAKVDGTGRKALVTEDLYDPRGIVVDPVSGTMFWTDWHRSAPRIERASMDGTSRKVLVEDDLGLPNGLTIDYETHHLCWVDAETKKIECVNYEGAGRRTIFTETDYPFDLAYTHHVFYWTDWHQKQLASINQFSAETNPGLDIPTGGHGRLYGLAVVRSQCPPGNNACSLNNGGCRFICMPTPNGGRTCACPDDIDPDECNRVGLMV